MNVSGKITMFVEKKQGKSGDFATYSGSISHKHEDGTYTNARIELDFDSKFQYKDKLPLLKEKVAYQLEVKEGWLDARAWEYEGKKQFRILIHVKDATILDSKEVVKNDSSKPF